MDELIGVFIAESQDFLQSMEEDLLAMEGTKTSKERLERIKNLFRAAHSIKGGALMFGLENLSTAAHALEDCFAILRDRSNLSELETDTATMLLKAVDVLKNLVAKTSRGEEIAAEEIEEIIPLKSQLEKVYGKEKPKAKWTQQGAVNTDIIKVIFENDLLPLFEGLESEISQVEAGNMEQTTGKLNEIYYQLSGVAGMLQLSEFAATVEPLRELIDTPELSVEELREKGWAIAQNLQTARQQVLAGEAIGGEVDPPQPPLERGGQVQVPLGKGEVDPPQPPFPRGGQVQVDPPQPPFPRGGQVQVPLGKGEVDPPQPPLVRGEQAQVPFGKGEVDPPQPPLPRGEQAQVPLVKGEENPPQPPLPRGEQAQVPFGKGEVDPPQPPLERGGQVQVNPPQPPLERGGQIQVNPPQPPLERGGQIQVPLVKGDLGGSSQVEEEPQQAQVPLVKGDLGGSSQVEETSAPPAVPIAPGTWQRPTIRVDLEHLTELVNLVGELAINRTHLELQQKQLRSETKRMRRNLFELDRFGTQLRDEYDRLSFFPHSGNPPQPPLERGEQLLPFAGNNGEQLQVPLTKGDNGGSARFDPLEMDRYNEFHTAAQSAIETTRAIANSAGKVDELSLKLERSTDLLRRITDRLRSRVIQLRVVPFSKCVDALPRALRELSQTYNKEVNLLLLGRDTKVDESLADALRDPLVHLVRNAFDHGIESPEARKAAGKPPIGQIEIAARHQGGQTIIAVTDDGRGIDPEKIRQRAIAKDWFSAEQANELSVAELYELLFWSGFSTANSTTDLSGRGVGLDIVRDNLRKVRGTVKVDSRVGRGTTFILKLPLMLSIANALLVRTEHNTVAVPLDAVEEILHIRGEEIQLAGTQPMLAWRGEFIRLTRLQELLRYSIPSPEGPSPDPLNQDHIPVLVVASAEGVLAIAVERLVGQQEIVVKPLPPPLSKPRGIVGCTILGDGSAVTILDVDDLIVQFHPRTTGSVAVTEKSHLADALHANSQAPQILAIDDSYTIRQLLSLSLQRARYRVETAKDGQEALEKLEGGIDCDLAIVDIEMPRVDGFEFLRRVKSNPSFADIPVAMLTSRSGAKHRQLAMELGACYYFTKPYNEAQLLDAISKIINN